MSKNYELEYQTYTNNFISLDHREINCYELSKFLREEYHLKYVSKQLWIWREKCYVRICDEELRQIISNITKRRAKQRWVVEAVSAARSECLINPKNFRSPEGYINLENGVFDLKKEMLLKHDPLLTFKNVVPLEFNANAECPNFISFLKDVTNDDSEMIELISQIFGYCLLGGDPFLHKAFVFVGDGRNGKSTVFDVLKNLLGHENVSSISMGNLDKPFSVVQLDGKLANIAGETPNRQLNADAFKTAIGGEVLTAAFKGKDEYGLKCNARLIFACNEMPIFKDRTKGMLEKMIFLPFNKYIPEDKRDYFLMSKLKPELSGILNFAISGLRSVLKNHRLVKPKSCELMHQEYRIESDSVFRFFKEEITIDEMKLSRLFLKDVYYRYTTFCGEQNIHKMSRPKFSKAFQKLVDEAHKGEVVEKLFAPSKHGYYFRGINFVEKH